MQNTKHKKHIFTATGTFLLVLTTVLSGCGTPKISVIEVGKDYVLNDIVQVTADYEGYNVQAPIEQVASDLTAKAIKSVTVKSHTVTATTEETNEGGKYDVVDSITVSVEGADLNGALPQTINETMEYKRLKGTDTWEQTSVTCTKWGINYKKLGGTAWKKTEGDKTYYLRISGSIEFLRVDTGATKQSADITKFDTSIMSAYAIEENGKVEVKRALILSGTLTSDGIVTLVMNQENGVPDIVLSEYEKIDKSELPFSEEEYKAATAAR